MKISKSLMYNGQTVIEYCRQHDIVMSNIYWKVNPETDLNKFVLCVHKLKLEREREKAYIKMIKSSTNLLKKRQLKKELALIQKQVTQLEKEM